MSPRATILHVLAVLSLALGVAPLCAQESATEPASPPAQSDQPDNQDQQRGRGERGMDRMLGMVPLLRVETVRQELGVNDEQSKSIETTSLQIREEFGQQIREFMQSFRDLSPEERRARRDESDGRLAEIRGKINERLRGDLDEKQFQRLQEIEVQRLVRTSGVGALTSDDLAASLDLTDEQKQQLREQGQAARDANEAISLEDVRAKVKDILTPDQMGKLETLFGAAFDLPREMLERGRGRFGGGRGGREGGLGIRRQRPAFEGEEPAATEPAGQ